MGRMKQMMSMLLAVVMVISMTTMAIAAPSSTQEFDKAAPQDVSYSIGASALASGISSIESSGTAIGVSDFSLGNDIITFNKDYLAKQTVDTTVTVTVVFNVNEAAFPNGYACDIQIVDTTPVGTAPSVTTKTATFDLEKTKQADVAITVALGTSNLAATGIQSVSYTDKDGTKPLVAEEYSFAGTTLTIKKAFLAEFTKGDIGINVVFNDKANTKGSEVTVSIIDTTTKPVDPDDNDGGSGSGSGSGSNSGDNVANKPETSDKITSTVDAVKNLDLNNVAAGKLPAGVVIEKTAGGSAIATIPMNLTSGSASLNASLMEIMGAASSKVGLKLTVSTNEMNSKDSVEIIIPGGFGKINEAGRLSYPMDYKSKADDNDKMLAAVKTKDAISTTAQIGGNFTLPTAATITVNFTAPEGSLVNIYKFDPITGKNIYLGQGKVIKNKLTFATKMMGQMLFTTGKI